MVLKLYNAGGFETERRSARNVDFSFRRKAQVLTYINPLNQEPPCQRKTQVRTNQHMIFNRFYKVV